MNIDPLHPHGRPGGAQLGNAPYVRFAFQWKAYAGQSFDDTARFYEGVINQYLAAGKQIILVLTHQLGLEGIGFDWTQMDGRWPSLITRYSDHARMVAQRFAGRRLLYQIWNEQDTPPQHARAAVPVPAIEYGRMFRATAAVIKNADASATVITGGHVTGPGIAPLYFRTASIQPDVVCIHEYGRGARSNPDFRHFGAIEDTIATWRPMLRSPLMVTEFGVLDQPNADENRVAKYAADFQRAALAAGSVPSLWYAWHSGDNGYGVIAPDGRVRVLLHTVLTGGTAPKPDDPKPDLPNPVQALITLPPGQSLNFRSAPTVKAGRVGILYHATALEVADVKDDERPFADDYWWEHGRLGGKQGYFAQIPGLVLWKKWKG